MKEKKYAPSLLSLMTIVIYPLYMFRHLKEVLQVFFLVYLCSVWTLISQSPLRVIPAVQSFRQKHAVPALAVMSGEEKYPREAWGR